MKQLPGNNGLPTTVPNYSFVPGSGRALSPMRKTWCRKLSSATGGISVNSPETRRPCSSLQSGVRRWILPGATAGAQRGRIWRKEDWRRPRRIFVRCLEKVMSVDWKSRPHSTVCRRSNVRSWYSRSGRNLLLRKSAKFSPFHPTPLPRAIATHSAHCARN